MQGRSQTEERALIAGAQAGDQEAMERIVTQYWPLVIAAGHQRYVRSIAEDATGAAAEELVRAVLAFDLSRGVPFAAFAKVRVYGAVSHLFRKTANVWEHEGAPCDMETFERVTDDGTLDASDARLTVAPLLAKLSRDERRVLFFLYQYGWSTYETAEALGVSQSRVCRLKRGAIEKLRAAGASSSMWTTSTK